MLKLVLAARRIAPFALSFCVMGCTSRSEPSHIVSSGGALSVQRVVDVSGDSYVLGSAPDQNMGGEGLLRIRALGRGRALLFFDRSALAAAADGCKVSQAKLRLQIVYVDHWSAGTRALTLHRLLPASSESGATWNCAVDADPSDQDADCSGASRWNMDGMSAAELPWVAEPSATLDVVNHATGSLSWDVSADVEASLSGAWTGAAWLLRYAEEGQLGETVFRSRESAAGPQLVLQVDDEDCRVDAGSDAGPSSCDDGDRCNGVETRDDYGDCVPGSPPTADPTCDGVDDDCDGRSDEDYPQRCGADGFHACNQGNPQTTACSDGDACSSDACDPTLGCTHAPLVCDDGDACTADACDPASGCRHTAIACDDGDACTVDACDGAGGCTHAPLVCDDGDACTADACDPSRGCQHSAVGCDDGDACTADACDAVLGCSHSAIACNDGSACTADACDPTLGCVHATLACDDGSACTADACDPMLGCLHAVLACNDGNACTADVCDPAGGCGHAVIGCSDNDACTADACDPILGCTHMAVACNDGNACTADVCDPAGGCGHAVIGCSDNDACTADACDPILGCTHMAVACNDGNACTADACDPAGGCTHAAVACSDDNACTADACDPIAGCTHSAVVCDDNSACTTDACDPIAGCTHVAVACNDNDACTTDACDAAGGCTHVAVACSDSDACTTDACDPNSGCTHVAVACSDSDACTTDACDPNSGCTHVAVACSDSDACTTDACDPMLGCSHVALSCDDANSCTVDACAATSGCSHVALGCDDGNACTSDSCATASGCAHAAVNCDDADPCTADSCDPVLGCAHFALACDDADPCTVDTCAASGGCQHVAQAPDDANACTADSCDAQQGVLHTNLPVGSGCGGQRLCDGAGTCIAFPLCASEYVVGPGQNLTLDGPCEVTSLVMSGGSLTVNGALKTPSVTLQSGGSLVVTGALISGPITVVNGSLELQADVAGTLSQSGGSVSVRGDFDASQGFNLSGGSFVNAGRLELARCDETNLRTATFVNRGTLVIGNDALVVPSGVTFNESGRIGDADRVGSLRVDGTLTHDPGLAEGLTLTVSGDASVSPNGRIDLSSRGLAGGSSAANSTHSQGRGYVLRDGAWRVDWVGTADSAGSHGGVGAALSGASGPSNDSLSAPVLLGSAGGGLGGTIVGGNGGGRLDLSVGGRLTVDGLIQANGGSGNDRFNSGGGAGGSLRLRVGTLAGGANGQLLARGGGNGAGAGGGRIAIEYDVLSFAGIWQVNGGTQDGSTAAVGGAGTIYLRDRAGAAGELIVDNAGNPAGPTVLDRLETPLAKVSVRGKANLIANAAASLSWAIEGGALSLSENSTAATFSVSDGTLNVAGAWTPASVSLSRTGILVNSGRLTLSTSSTLQMSGGTLQNTGVLAIPAIDGASIRGGLLVNRGELDIASDVLDVPAGVTVSESGSLGPGDSIGRLNVQGTLIHDSRLEAGLAFTVRGDATVGSNGRIEVSRRGLAGYTGPNNEGPGQGYIWNGARWLAGPAGGTTTGGSHAGVGTGAFGQTAGPSNDTLSAPILLGGGGGGSDVSNGFVGGAGGGRVDLVVNGTLTLDGTLLANGADAPSNCGGGAGGSIRLRLGRFAGTGALRANGGGGTGGGGGGRIALEYLTKSFTGSVEAIGAVVAGAGTIFERNLTTDPFDSSALVRAAGATVCKLSANGAIGCSGDDSAGLVSDAPAGIYSRLSLGPEVACALHAAGMAHCWGRTFDSLLHNEPPDAFSEIAVGLRAACAIRKSDAGLICWGDDADRIVSAKPSQGQFIGLAMAERSACAIRSDGQLECWGDDTSGAVSQAPALSFTAAEGGDGFLCGVTTDGSLRCWGANGAGQTAAPSGRYTNPSAGRSHACALDELGNAICWGDDSSGQSTVEMGTFVSIACADAFSCGITAEQALVCWGDLPAL